VFEFIVCHYVYSIGVCDVFDFGDILEYEFMEVFKRGCGGECWDMLCLIHPLCFERCRKEEKLVKCALEVDATG
jgi:hypothetical protein